MTHSLIFNRTLFARRRAHALQRKEGHSIPLFLKTEVDERLCENLSCIQRSFKRIWDMGGATGTLGHRLSQIYLPELAITTDLSPAPLEQQTPSLLKVVADEELSPFAPHQFDLVVSSLALQWVNDLPGCLSQVYRTLVPDGLFVGAFMGGDTLWELRDCLTTAELEMLGGISPRISPMVDIKTAGHLLQRTGFQMPAAVSEKLTVWYTSPLQLLQDLRHMGQTAAFALLEGETTRPLHRGILGRMCELYHARYGNAQGQVRATFEVITLTGWHAHENQPTPAKPLQSQHR